MMEMSVEPCSIFSDYIVFPQSCVEVHKRGKSESYFSTGKRSQEDRHVFVRLKTANENRRNIIEAAFAETHFLRKEGGDLE